MKNLFDLSGRVAWIAGGGGYLANPVCRMLAEFGAKLIIADARTEAAESPCALLTKDGFLAEPMTLDIGDEAGVSAAGEKIRQQRA